MTEKERIAELEAKLATLQKDEAGGKDPEAWAKAKQYARMSWSDTVVALEAAGYTDINEADLKVMQDAITERKYANIIGANKSALGWIA